MSLSRRNLLIDAGISESAASIYLYLLEVKRATILLIAQETKVKRTSIYGYCKELLDLGLIGEAIESGKRYFVPESPSHLLDVIQYKKELARNLSDQIMKDHRLDFKNTEIKYGFGVEGFKRFVDEILLHKSGRVKIFLRYDASRDYVSHRYLRNLLERKVKNKVFTDIIVSSDEKTVLKKNTSIGFNINNLLQIKSLPSKKCFAMSIVVVNEKVYFFAPKNEGYMLMFDSPAFADTMNKMFDYMWGKSDDVN